MSVQMNFGSYLFTGNASMQSRTQLTLEIQLHDWSTTGEQGKLVFVAITGTFHNVKTSSFGGPNYTSIQVLHFKIFVEKKRRKEICFAEQIFFS